MRFVLPIVAVLLPAPLAAQVIGLNTSDLSDEDYARVMAEVAETVRLLQEGETEEVVRRMDALDPEGFHAQCRPADGEEQRFAQSADLPEMTVRLGDPARPILAQFPQYFPYESSKKSDYLYSLSSSQKMRIAIDLDGVVIRSNTGGMGNVANDFSVSSDAEKIQSLEFYDQQCPLVLDDALARAQALEAQLLEAGFTLRPDRPRLLAAETFGPESGTSAEFASWEDARADLAVAPRLYAQVSSAWVRGDERALVSVHNWGGYRDPERDERFPGLALNVFEIDGTFRKYGVSFYLIDHAIRQAEMAQRATVKD